MLRKYTVAVVLLAVLPISLASARTWTSASGAVQIEAELVEMRPDGTVVLKKSDGVTIETKPEKFSAADQEYIKQWKPPASSKPSDDLKEADAPAQEASALTLEEKTAMEKIQSADAKAAVRAYEQREKELGDTYAAKRKEHREKLAGLLEEALKEATTAGNLDDALAIRNAVKALRSGQDPATDQLSKEGVLEPAESTTAAGQGKKPRKGQARPESGRPYVRSTWNHLNQVVVRLFSDGKCDTSGQNSGTWSLTGRVLTMSWTSGSVDTLIVAEDGRSYRGKSNGGSDISGRLISGKPLKADADRKE